MATRYGDWSLDQLKAELRKRNAKLSGRKRELIERLEFYDRNQNYGPSEVCPDFTMWTPSATEYKDINSETELPPVTIGRYEEYCSRFSKHDDVKVRQLYKEKFIITARSTAAGRLFFVKARVAAEMKKRVVYTVDVSMDSHGVVRECQCECGAGMGPEAHCKHVLLVIFALVNFHISKEISVRDTCTERIQSFHRGKKYTGSPVKAQNLRLRKNSGNLTIPKLASYDPRQVQFINSEEYQSHFSNRCTNFPQIMPIKQLIPQANLKAVFHDHDYLQFTPDEQFLRSMNIASITNEKVKEIELNTRGQQGNKQWFIERSYRITSSNFGTVCKATPLTNFKNLAKRLMNKSDAKCAATEHGKMYEGVAVQNYKELTGQEVKDSGLFVCQSSPFLASSDGLVDDDGVLEVKCPYSARDKEISVDTIPYLRETSNGELTVDRSHNYYYQIQGQLLCTQRKYCDFVIFTFEDIKIIRHSIDEDFLNEMLVKLNEFYCNYFRKAVLDKYLYRSASN